MSSSNKFDESEYLRQLAEKAQRAAPKTRERQQALAELLSVIQRSQQFYHPRREELSSSVYQEIYREAKQETYLFICKQIDDYDSKVGKFMPWFNKHLHGRYLRVVSDWRSRYYNQVSDPEQVKNEQYFMPEDTPSLADQLRQLIKDDPKGIFSNISMRDHPEINFKMVMLRRLDGKRWREIAEEFGIPENGLRSFFHRALKKLKPDIEGFLD